MEEMYIKQGNKRLRCGYTTGSCAAAAAYAAAEYLLTGNAPEYVLLTVPKGITLKLRTEDMSLTDGRAVCAIRKDSGDDPDITNGILVYAAVSRTESGVNITGGEGIGTVTKNGLDQPAGSPAINSVPRKMIAEAVMKTAAENGCDCGFDVEIFVPDGRELAKKTYNPYMGIEGGISIIGTTGIVEPMSTAALIDTIRAEASVRRCEGMETMLMTLGNYGEDFLKEFLPHISDRSVKCSNYIGEAIDIALENDFSGVLIVGHIGKLAKLGAGIMNTHSALADGRTEVLVTCGLLAGADNETLLSMTDCATADDALEKLREKGFLERSMEILAQKIEYHLEKKVKNAIPMGAVVFSNKYGILCRTSRAEMLAERIGKECGR